MGGEQPYCCSGCYGSLLHTEHGDELQTTSTDSTDSWVAEALLHPAALGGGVGLGGFQGQPGPPQLPQSHPCNLGHTHPRPESGQLPEHTIEGIYGIKPNEFWEMFLGAFKSSLHIMELNWAAADERVGGSGTSVQPSTAGGQRDGAGEGAHRGGAAGRRAQRAPRTGDCCAELQRGAQHAAQELCLQGRSGSFGAACWSVVPQHKAPGAGRGIVSEVISGNTSVIQNREALMWSFVKSKRKSGKKQLKLEDSTEDNDHRCISKLL